MPWNFKKLACVISFQGSQQCILVTVVHPIAPGSNQQVAAWNQQAIFVAQQQTSVAKQPKTSSADAASDHAITQKQQEAINAAFNEPQRENPPSYFDD